MKRLFFLLLFLCFFLPARPVFAATVDLYPSEVSDCTGIIGNYDNNCDNSGLHTYTLDWTGIPATITSATFVSGTATLGVMVTTLTANYGTTSNGTDLGRFVIDAHQTGLSLSHSLDTSIRNYTTLYQWATAYRDYYEIADISGAYHWKLVVVYSSEPEPTATPIPTPTPTPTSTPTPTPTPTPAPPYWITPNPSPPPQQQQFTLNIWYTLYAKYHQGGCNIYQYCWDEGWITLHNNTSNWEIYHIHALNWGQGPLDVEIDPPQPPSTIDSYRSVEYYTGNDHPPLCGGHVCLDNWMNNVTWWARNIYTGATTSGLLTVQSNFFTQTASGSGDFVPTGLVNPESATCGNLIDVYWLGAHIVIPNFVCQFTTWFSSIFKAIGDFSSGVLNSYRFTQSPYEVAVAQKAIFDQVIWARAPLAYIAPFKALSDNIPSTLTIDDTIDKPNIDIPVTIFNVSTQTLETKYHLQYDFNDPTALNGNVDIFIASIKAMLVLIIGWVYFWWFTMNFLRRVRQGIFGR